MKYLGIQNVTSIARYPTGRNRENGWQQVRRHIMICIESAGIDRNSPLLQSSTWAIMDVVERWPINPNHLLITCQVKPQTSIRVGRNNFIKLAFESCRKRTKRRKR